MYHSTYIDLYNSTALYLYRAGSRVDNGIEMYHSTYIDLYNSTTLYLYKAGSRVDNGIEMYHSTYIDLHRVDQNYMLPDQSLREPSIKGSDQNSGRYHRYFA